MDKIHWDQKLNFVLNCQNRQEFLSGGFRPWNELMTEMVCDWRGYVHFSQTHVHSTHTRKRAQGGGGKAV